MKKVFISFLLAFGLTGCAIAPSTTTLTPKAQAAEKSAGAVCATAGAALSSLVIAGATATLLKIKPEAEALKPACTASTPGAAITKAEAEAYSKIISAAAPYMGD